MFADTDTEIQQAEGGENYFVSMTDMMVGMLFLFIILLMVFALNYRVGDENAARVRDCLNRLLQRNAALSAEIDKNVNRIQTDVRRQIEALQLAADQRWRLLTDLRQGLKSEGIGIDIDERNGVMHLTEESIRFEPSRWDLSEKARDNVAHIARVLSTVVPRYAACRVETVERCGAYAGAALDTIFVEGHTDTTGNPDQNWDLSTERAIATYRAILANYPELRGFRNRRNEEIISVSGYSSTRPINLNATREAWAANRRIDLRFVMDAETTINLRELLLLNEQIRAQIARLAQISQESIQACQ